MGLIEHTPTGWLRRFFRAPIPLYRMGFGPLLGNRLLYLVHTGRKSGRQREVILEVVGLDRQVPEVVVVSGWGERSDWYRNIKAAPAREIRLGRHRWPAPEHRILPDEEVVRVLTAYRDRHPGAWRRIAPLLGFPPDPASPPAREALARVRAVAFRPAGRR